MTFAIPDINLNTTKRKLIALAVLVLVFITGFAFGKFNSKPNVSIEKHETTTSETTTADKTKTVDIQQDTKKNAESANVSVNQVQDTDTVTTTTTDKKPDGEVITTEKTETKAHVDNSAKSNDVKQSVVTQTDEKKVADKVVTDTKTTDKLDFKETITQSQPKWMIGAFGGVDTSGLGLNGNALVTGPLLYGVEGGYRFLGPLWIDAKVMKAGGGFAAAAGLQLQF